ncbi:MAG: IscS subfamily cysteine desulfurase [Myxococcota bacterium]|nr:IscS subfamily cysteine desulfurase [Myxococcota bacterium]MEC8424237.1 IscS subfamily cysteine desulfurase [Myxococcota bacterium]
MSDVTLPLYLDNNATTPTDPRVVEAMIPYLSDKFGNPASRNHSFGWAAREAVELAREQVGALIGATAKEIIFTSGATESDNLAIKGVARFYESKGKHIITVATEHKAILDACHAMERDGYEVTYLDVDDQGLIDLDELRAAIRPDTTLVSIMFANNEIGVIQPVTEIGAICRENGVIFHCDAVQALAYVPIDVKAMNIDVLSISAHKMYGPKGIGALFVRRGRPRVRLQPLIDGGGHERGMRSGTLATHQIVGLGAAAVYAKEAIENGEVERIQRLRDRLWNGLREHLDELYLNGSWEHRLPNNLNVSFAYVEGEAMMMGIKDIACSSGSACTSASLEPSYVLRALGVDVELAHTSIRFGIGRFNTEAEIDWAIAYIAEKAGFLREMSPLYEMVKEGIDLKSIQWEAH